jgi:hypothetical protein
VYVNVSDVQIQSADVNTARYFGVAVNGSSGSAIIDTSDVHHIGDVVDAPNVFGGSQHGIAVAFLNGATGTIRDANIHDYQKGGVVANGTGTSLDTLSSIVRGLGPVPYIAQNGVQYSDHATGLVRDNLITDHQYTGCSKQQSRTGSCVYYESIGLLLLNVEPKDIKRSLNLYRDNDKNEFVWPSSSYANAFQ